MRIDLTDEEWDLLSGERMHDDDSALPCCCGNISALRCAVMAIRDNDGEATSELLSDLATVWQDARESHDKANFPGDVLERFIAQAGLPWDVALVRMACTKDRPFVGPAKEYEYWEHEDARIVYQESDYPIELYHCPNCGADIEVDMRD